MLSLAGPCEVWTSARFGPRLGTVGPREPVQLILAPGVVVASWAKETSHLARRLIPANMDVS